VTLRRLLPLLGGILVALMLPTPSAMAAHHYIAPAGYLTTVQLHGSNGYWVDVGTGSPLGVTVDVHRGGASTAYSVQGTKKGKYGAEARFPGLGRVRFHFVPNANGRERRVPPPPWCEGRAGRLIEGVVQGRIRFTGEDGYTRVAVKRAKAEVETWPEWRCRAQEPRKGPRKVIASFESFSGDPPYIRFEAKRFARHVRPRSRRAVFRAEASRTQGPLRIFYSAFAAADASSFVSLDPRSAPENVTFVPPPPFSGTGTFQRTPESVFSWEGDLSVQFPGTAPVALTGPAFHTIYCALRGCAVQDPPFSS
jgi:hypothetical protein